MTVTKKEQNMVSTGTIYVPLATAGAIFLMLGSFIYYAISAENEIYTTINKNREELSTEILNVNNNLKHLSEAVSKLTSHLNQRTRDRYTNEDSYIRCLENEVFNKGGFTCVDGPNGPKYSWRATVKEARE